MIEGSEGKLAGAADDAAQDDGEAILPLISLASALLDLDRLRIAGLMVKGPVNRMELEAATGLTHKELLRHLDSLTSLGIARLAAPMPREPDHYSLYELNPDAFKAARQAMGKYKGVRKRPTDSRLMTLETFMPDGKVRAFPLKQSQMIVILDEIAKRFEEGKQYSEREVNAIIEEAAEDYATIRRCFIEYGYMRRTPDGSVYELTSDEWNDGEGVRR